MINMNETLVMKALLIMKAREKEYKNDETWDLSYAYGVAADILESAIDGDEKVIDRLIATQYNYCDERK